MLGHHGPTSENWRFAGRLMMSRLHCFYDSLSLHRVEPLVLRMTLIILRTLINLSLYLIETHFSAFANREDQDQAALLRAA